MITSIISIAIATAVLWLAYRVLFINSNRLTFNRAFLIVALGFSLILPAVGMYIGRSTPQIVSYRESLFQGIMLDEVVITAEGVTISKPVENTADNEGAAPAVAGNKISFDIRGIMRLIWLIGAIGAALVFLFKLGRIVNIIIRSPKKKMQGFTAVFTGKEHGPYSFFNYAFFTDEDVSPEIVRHEKSHIEHHHSADIIFVELMMILQWFNPFIYLYKRELQSLHEYMADHDVVATGVDKKNYMMLILQQCTAVDFSGMSNNFSLILTKKRIKMITQNKKAKGVVIKALLTLPVFALLLFANCKSNGQEKTSSVEQTVETENPVEAGETVTFKLSDGTYLSVPHPFEIHIEGQQHYLYLNDIKNDTTIMLGNHEFYAVKNNDERNSLSVKIDGKNFEIDFAGGIMKDDSKIYAEAVEEAPEFPGGTTALFDFINKNVKYPKSARDKGIEGRVFVQFVVEKDGSLSSFTVLRGVSDELDAEAIRVLKVMPKWKPGMNDGKPVRVQFVMPFNFKLSDDGNTMTALSGTQWEGRGIGVMDGVTYDMFMTMSFYQDNDGLFVMKLVAEQNGEKAVVFKDVALDFKYTFDGKSTGSIQPKNPDGSDLGEAQPPYGFVVKEKSIVVNFYDFKDDCGIEEITFVKK
ncbi:MAG: M56 family metallopeptidase [Bacteroidales bacterium]|nr:M56 family metallopeptidase [Bacteroidales bacterium]